MYVEQSAAQLLPLQGRRPTIQADLLLPQCAAVYFGVSFKLLEKLAVEIQKVAFSIQLAELRDDSNSCPDILSLFCLFIRASVKVVNPARKDPPAGTKLQPEFYLW